MIDENNIWLPEPQVIDNTWARRREHTLDWLARSTLPRAQTCRRFLNHNTAALPETQQPLLQHALRERWKSAFFELIVIRTMQALEASVSIELAISSGRRPDVQAYFPDGSVTVEAISPVFNAGVRKTEKNYLPLIELIEARVPKEWSVAVWKLPRLGLNDSRKQFKQAIEELLNLPPVKEDTQPLDLVYELLQGTIHLQAVPRHVEGHSVVIEPALAFTDDSILRIEYALDRKRSQVRGADAPVLLAIEASGMASGLEDFDIALFGRRVGRYIPGHGVVDAGFAASGVFTRSQSIKPIYAGVLAFMEVGFRAGPDPVLFPNPRFDGALPAQLLKLDTHAYQPDTGIQVRASAIAGFRSSLGFVEV